MTKRRWIAETLFDAEGFRTSYAADRVLFPHRERFAKGLLEGRIIGQKSPVSGKVYVPGRGYDNLERVLLTATAGRTASFGCSITWVPVRRSRPRLLSPAMRR